MSLDIVEIKDLKIGELYEMHLFGPGIVRKKSWVGQGEYDFPKTSYVYPRDSITTNLNYGVILVMFLGTVTHHSRFYYKFLWEDKIFYNEDETLDYEKFHIRFIKFKGKGKE